MSHSTHRRRTRQLQTLRTQFALGDGLAFADILPAQRVERALREEQVHWRERVYTPVLTLWAFLSQVICKDGSCRITVARVLAWLVSQGEPACTPKTDPYCKARRRLPESLLRRLTRESGRDLCEQAPPPWRWRGRRVKVADGTTVSMPDTKANQAEYPQSRSQKPGLGFPLARLVVVFCLATGTVLEAALGPYRGKRTGENALLRTLADGFDPGDVLLFDRYFGGWFDIALWRQRGVDVVGRLHQLRRADFRKGRRLGASDHVVCWPKPPRPEWMDKKTYASLPDELSVRELAVRVEPAGFRTKNLVVVTTLLDDEAFPPRELACLYRMRWHAELDLRSLKVVLGMDVLRCKSPEMVRKELWAHFLAYNLIRGVMARAAQESGLCPRTLSFTGALQTMKEFAKPLLYTKGGHAEALRECLLIAVASHRVGDRPDRVEPRARKRRPKDYPQLRGPRHKRSSLHYAKT
jgi:hypothetical protein